MSFLGSLRQVLGGAPTKPVPADYTPAATALHEAKRSKKRTKEDTVQVKDAIEQQSKVHKWRWRRWVTLVMINLLFVVSYHFDVQLIEGALTASRVFGFHFADLNSSLQVALAFKTVPINLVIGTSTVLILWWLMGGRTFCSWTCPYHLLAEWAEMLHLKLAAKGWVKDHALDRRLRTVLYVIFASLAFGTGFTVYETISPTGILSRGLIYGTAGALSVVAVLLVLEVVYTRRLWCRYMCPIGVTYAAVGLTSPLRVVYRPEVCHHDGACRKVCLVPHVLECTKKGLATDVHVGIGADCTRCGLCVDACPTRSLKFEVRGLNSLL